MKKNEKGFTLIEVLAVIVLLSVLMALALTSMNYYMNRARKASYKEFETTLKNSTTNYLLEHSGEVPNVGGSFRISANQLIDKGYLSNMKDPSGGGTCNDNSFVIVKRNNDVSFNMDLEYHPCLKCRVYKTNDSVCSF